MLIVIPMKRTLVFSVIMSLASWLPTLQPTALSDLEKREQFELIESLSDRLRANVGDKEALSRLKQIAATDSEILAFQVNALAGLRLAAKDHPEQLVDLVPFFIQLASHKQQAVRGEVAMALGVFGRSAHAGVDTLIAMIRSDRGKDVAGMAAESLGKIGEAPEKVVPFLVGEMCDPRKLRWQSLYRLSEVEALGKFGNKAKEAIPKLVAALHDRDAIYRGEVILALSRIDPNVQTSDQIGELLGGENPTARHKALLAVSNISKEQRSPRLVSVLESLACMESEDSRRARRILGRIPDCP